MRLFSSQKHRLIFSALLPGLLAAALLVGGVSWIFVNENNHQRADHWDASMQLLTELAAPAVKQDHAALQQLALSVLNIPGLRSITYYDAAYNQLAHAGPQARAMDTTEWPPANAAAQKNPYYSMQSNDSVRYFWPLYRTTTTREIAGWVDVEFSTLDTDRLLYRTIIIAILATLVVSCLSVMAAAFLYRHNNRTLMNLLRELRLIRDGELTSLQSSGDSDETNQLIGLLNQTIGSLQRQLLDMKEHVDHSTQDLRETLETIEIQNIELDLARKEALQASKMKSEFLANTSHEIRTPLNGIIGFTRILLKNNNNPQQQEYLTTIQQSSEALLNIINDILDLSKIEAGKLVLDYSAFNIHNIIEDTLQILAPAAHEKGLELVHIINAEVPENVYGDPSRIRQILTNLISNAIKFSNSGCITVRVALEHRQESSAVLKCSVSDSGIGIRRSQLNQDLFNAFTQGDGNFNRHRDGTGLGLAIAKKLVDQMGGDIGIDSEENVGSTFWFTLRLDIDSQTLPTQSYHLNGQSILLFDTNAASRQAISYMLTQWGINVSLTQSYNDILPALASNAHLTQQHWYNAVIISVAPENTSFPIDRLGELVANISKYCRPIICTPTTLRHYLNKILSEKTLYVNKPINREKLFLALQSANETSEKAPSPQTATTPHTALPIETRHLASSGATSKNILVVDDNAANLKLLSKLLSGLGYSVHEASSGQEAIAMCRQTLFSIIFMDIRMPGMDGIETTQRIRALTNDNQTVPVIAVTAHALAEQKQHLLMSGLDDYLSKPLDEALLKRTLSRWTGNPADDNLLMTDAEDNPSIERCVDIALSLKLSNGSAQLATDMLSLLLDELELQYTAIKQALSESHFNDALDLIHKLHGATCYCGVPQLKQACKTLELQLQIRQKMPDINDVYAFDAAVESLLAWQKNYDIQALFSVER